MISSTVKGGRTLESGRAPCALSLSDFKSLRDFDAVNFKQREKVPDLVRFHDSAGC